MINSDMPPTPAAPSVYVAIRPYGDTGMFIIVIILFFTRGSINPKG